MLSTASTMGMVRLPLPLLREEMYILNISKRDGESANEGEVSLGSCLLSAEEDEGDGDVEEGLNGGASGGRGNAVTLEDELPELLVPILTSWATCPSSRARCGDASLDPDLVLACPFECER